MLDEMPNLKIYPYHDGGWLVYLYRFDFPPEVHSRGRFGTMGSGSLSEDRGLLEA